MNSKQQLEQRIGAPVEEHKDLSPFTTLHIASVAEYFVEPATKEQLIASVRAARELDIPYLFMGGGSNMALGRNPLPGLTIRNLYSKKEIVSQSELYTDLFVSSGYPMGRLVKETVELGLSGFEYHLGLPGTLGGAMYMNSKWMHPETYAGDTLIRAWVLDSSSTIKEVDRSYFRFAYDYSILQDTHELFIEGIFRLAKIEVEELRKRSKAALAYRKQTQPFGVSTGGCFFRNISDEEQQNHDLPTKSAGYLIDQSGLKGKQFGHFKISDKHANFVINQGGGTASELTELLSMIKSKVKERFGIDLHEEVVVV
ncbi:UDP-N-acetylmuramate dehydrogenase [Candidatus Woesebacteria bacterium]|nr:UDP-N-acetylmuramate dehydrogenase [Candidatus Woesebacteria bacterium]